MMMMFDYYLDNVDCKKNLKNISKKILTERIKRKK